MLLLHAEYHVFPSRVISKFQFLFLLG